MLQLIQLAEHIIYLQAKYVLLEFFKSNSYPDLQKWHIDEESHNKHPSSLLYSVYIKFVYFIKKIKKIPSHVID